MDECLRQSRRKLVIWFTKNFKPIMTHDELEPIMATLGFIGLEPDIDGDEISWKSYKYSGADSRTKSVSLAEPTPTPRLPYPSIDGLHIYTYTAFLDAVNFHLHKYNISDLFHIRGLPLCRNEDQNRKWSCMDKESTQFVFREETVDQTNLDLYNFYKNCHDNNDTSRVEENGDHRNTIENNITEDIFCIVDLKDIITQQNDQ